MSTKIAPKRRVWSCTLSAEAYEERCALERRLRRPGSDALATARALHSYMTLCGISETECARRLGRSRAEITGLLRLLALPREALLALQKGQLTERHAMALLRLRDAAAQRCCFARITAQHLSPAETEELAATLLRGRHRLAVGDERLLLNSFSHCAEKLRRWGVPCRMENRSTPEALVLTVTVERGQRSLPEAVSAGIREEKP